jgi:hypothetical protein
MKSFSPRTIAGFATLSIGAVGLTLLFTSTGTVFADQTVKTTTVQSIDDCVIVGTASSTNIVLNYSSGGQGGKYDGSGSYALSGNDNAGASNYTVLDDPGSDHNQPCKYWSTESAHTASISLNDTNACYSPGKALQAGKCASQGGGGWSYDGSHSWWTHSGVTNYKDVYAFLDAGGAGQRLSFLLDGAQASLTIQLTGVTGAIPTAIPCTFGATAAPLPLATNLAVALGAAPSPSPSVLPSALAVTAANTPSVAASATAFPTIGASCSWTKAITLVIPNSNVITAETGATISTMAGLSSVEIDGPALTTTVG